MSEEAPTPGNFLYRVLDYSALGCILIAPEELARGGITGAKTLPWSTCFYFFGAGVLLLCVNHFGLKVVAAAKGLVARLRSSGEIQRLTEQHRKQIERVNSEHEKEAQQAEGQILTLRRELEALHHTKPNFGKLTIHSAHWVVRDDDQSFIDAAPALRAQIKESLIDTIDIPVVNAHMGGDPKVETHKVLKLTYSYGENGAQQKIVKHEGSGTRLTLPELPDSRIAELERKAVDTHLMLSERERQEGLFLKSKVSDLENQIVELKRLPAPRLTIQSAHYGKPPGYTEDVTTVLQSRLRNNKLSFVVSSQSLDASLSANIAMISVMSSGPMFLRVVYSLGDLKDLVIVRSEGERLVLPE